MVPTLFRIFVGVLVDSRIIVRERKYLVMGSHLLMCLCYRAIMLGAAGSAQSMTLWIFIYGFFNEFIMASLASYAVQQGRKDSKWGQQDMQSIKFVGFGLAFAFSGIMAAYLTREDVMLPRIVFIICFFFSLAGAIQCTQLGKELE